MNADLNPAKAVFLEAVERHAPDQWPAFLDRACAGQTDLRSRVEALLEAHRKVGTVQHRDLAEGANSGPAATVDLPLPTERSGTSIGPYKLLEEIGEGGMGAVFLAQQSEPVTRLVALKVIKAGMDSRQVIARFEAERQALALMDHPNIARVFDGGTTPAGRPYFVMELVKGVPITRFCDERRLTPRQRLELFLPVCHAIQHAHQKGIIHRDVKPTNVLVALYDSQPVPKVIDFGVAKATGQPLTERTLVTGLGAVVGTPEYMSPEQAELNQLDIDTRSDVYSLGVLLYELLTGTTPLTRKRLKEAALLEVLRVIREEEPQRPSTRLSTTDELPSIAASRGTEPARLPRLVRGDLDWVVMKALEKDRNRRYETANGFAMDVQRYLCGEAVQAVPPTVGYRLRKFTRRNKGVLAVVGLVLFFFVFLGSGIGWAWRDRAARTAAQASNLALAVERAELLQRQGRRGEALAALERAQLLAREAEPGPPMTLRIDALQQLLDAEGRDEIFVAEFGAIRREAQTEVDVETSEFRSGRAYPKILEALDKYGVAPGVTAPAAAATHIQQRPAAIQAVVVAAMDESLDRVGRDQPGILPWLIDVLQKTDSDPWRNSVRRAWRQPVALEALAKDIDVRQQPPSFLLLVVRKLPIASPSRLDFARRVQYAYPGDFWANHELGWVLTTTGKEAEAIRYFTAALALRPDNPGTLLNRGVALHSVGELEAAVADLQRAVAIAPRYVAALESLADALAAQQKFEQAIDACRKAVELAPKSGRCWQYLGWAQYRFGDWRASIQALEKSCELQQGGRGDPGQWIVMALAHARLAAQAGLPEKEREDHRMEARRLYEQAAKQIDLWWPARPRNTIDRAIWDFRTEARELMGTKESKK